MKPGLKKLYTGDFNKMSQEWQQDGTVIITLSRPDEHMSYRFRVQDLYGEHEEVLEHDVIPTGPPQWIIDRMKEATKHEHKGNP